MFKVNSYSTVEKDRHRYLSFPDIIKSPLNENRLFLVYREGNSHHPTWSKLILQKSEDNGRTWDKQQEFPLNIDEDKYVWNCPRLSYVDNTLYITCDQKSGVFEKMAHFKTVHLTSTTEGQFFKIQETPFPGMVPDKIISFKNKLFCANHKIKSFRNGLIQLVSWSKDNGRLWYDTNIMAHDNHKQFCEASVVNMGDYLIGYLRDNSGHRRESYTVSSNDGICWNEPEKLPIFGQRITALKDEDKKDSIVGAFRNTDPTDLFAPMLKVSAFEHDIENDEIILSDIDLEYPENQYHFGYTGMVRTNPDEYIIAYYIKNNDGNPYIKLAYISKVK